MAVSVLECVIYFHSFLSEDTHVALWSKRSVIDCQPQEGEANQKHCESPDHYVMNDFCHVPFFLDPLAAEFMKLTVL